MAAIDIPKQFAGSGYLIVESPDDTTNIICQRGHIYANGDGLVESMDGATAAESRALRKLGTVVMHGDFGELSVAFTLDEFRDVARIMRPKQASISKTAA